jgi:GDP-L-fucose synthase
VFKKIKFLRRDLKDLVAARQACRGQEIVMNLAAKVGGIEFNKKHLGTMFRDNVLINTTVLEAARQENVECFLVISSACVYPRFCMIPTPEEEGFKDVPEPTNEGYGWAKRMAELQGRFYAQEFGMKIGIVRPYNCYGPRDHFDPEKSHVIPALIKRIFNGEDPLVVWGDGEQSRAFLYVKDFVWGLAKVIEKYPVPDPINIGTDEEIKIKDLIKLLLKLSGKNPEVFFDTTKPAGQPRRNCDTRKAKEKVGFEAKVSLEEGLKKTIDWYRHEFGK